MISDDEKLTADKIKGFLQNRHSGEEWAFLKELRTCTGHMWRGGYIDCYAVGLWQKNRSFISYEIKIARNDFQKDIQEFHVKQKVALENSTQFYYVCPSGLIDPSEVPDVAGLMWADSSSVKIKKVAPLRELKNGLSLEFVPALLRASAGKAERTYVWKYLGKEMDEKDLLKLAKDTYEENKERGIELEVKKRVAAINAEANSAKALREIINVLKLSTWGAEDWSPSMILEICKKIKASEESVYTARRIERNIEEIKALASSLSELIKEKPKDSTPKP